MLLVAAGNLAACAGWQGSASARMACCTGPGGCAMHAHGADGQTGSPKVVVSQAQADGCCASSESGGTTQTPQGLALVWTPALTAFTYVDVTPDVGRRPAWTQVSRPPPVRSVPRHLLLAVFLL